MDEHGTPEFVDPVVQTEELERGQSELERRPGTTARQKLPVADDACLGVAGTRVTELGFHTWVARGDAVAKPSPTGQHARSGADGGERTPLLVVALQQPLQTRIGGETRRSGLASRESHRVERLVGHRLECDRRVDRDPMGPFDASGALEAGHDHLDTAATQHVDEGHGFDLLEAASQGHQDTGRSAHFFFGLLLAVAAVDFFALAAAAGSSFFLPVSSSCWSFIRLPKLLL